jgi:O-antigen/teichoic acid export membrane protein
VTRLRQFIRGVGSSWLALLATVVYSILSVPVALRYLSVDEFGLFVLLLQVAAYFTLVEIGMSAATARILVDYKDDPNNGNYGSVILTGFCVFATQALIVLTVGILVAPWIVVVIGVPAAFAEIATFLLRWLAVTSALTMAFRIYGSILYANKRLDLIHIFMGANILFALGVLTVILAAGGGLAGLVWLFVAQTILAILLPLLTCQKLGLLPRKGCWGQPSIEKFRELFVFGRDIFLVNVGNQVLEASQLIIVTRTMGLTAAAIWSVSTKLFALVYQLISKIEGTAIVFFAEMMVRGEKDKLSTRFRQVYQLTAAVAVVTLSVAVAINGPFVSAWAKPALAWSIYLSSLLAVFVLLNTLTRCGGDFIIHTKKIGAFRYVYFMEAAAFVVLALGLSTRFAFYGVLGASLLCLILFRGTYTAWRMSRYFGQPMKVFWWTWVRRPLVAALLLVPFVATTSTVAGMASGPWLQLAIACSWVGIPSLIVLFTFVFPRDVTAEVSLRCQQLSSSGKR